MYTATRTAQRADYMFGAAQEEVGMDRAPKGDPNAKCEDRILASDIRFSEQWSQTSMSPGSNIVQ